jgi:hypothetical protein
MSKININRLALFIILIIFGIAYLYSKTLIYYEIVNCHSYDVNVYRARPTIYTLKYFYQYEDKYYFDQSRYTSSRKAIPSSAAKVRVCKVNPTKNYLISERSHSSSNYNFKNRSAFIDSFNINITKASDFYPAQYYRTTLDNKKPLIYPQNIDKTDYKKITNAINRVVCCEGSLIEKYILQKHLDDYKLYLIHYYLNDFSIDSKLISTYHTLIRDALDKSITIVIIDKNEIHIQKIYTPNDHQPNKNISK